MKIVVNSCYGGYGLSAWAKEQLGIDYSDDISRNQPDLVSLVENFPEKVDDVFSKLSVVEIPDNSTDWEISEYDGLETVTYVVDGKINHI